MSCRSLSCPCNQLPPLFAGLTIVAHELSSSSVTVILSSLPDLPEVVSSHTHYQNDKARHGHTLAFAYLHLFVSVWKKKKFILILGTWILICVSVDIRMNAWIITTKKIIASQYSNSRIEKREKNVTKQQRQGRKGKKEDKWKRPRRRRQ